MARNGESDRDDYDRMTDQLRGLQREQNAMAREIARQEASVSAAGKELFWLVAVPIGVIGLIVAAVFMF